MAETTQERKNTITITLPSQENLEFYDHLLNNPILGDMEIPPGKEEELLTDNQSAKLKELREQERLAEKLGLSDLVKKLLKDQIVVKESGRTSDTLALSPEGLKLWKIWLPAEKRCGSNGYNYDKPIPTGVMKKWLCWKEMNRFESYEIRHHWHDSDWGNPDCDAALFGILNGQYYLLARWDENGDDLSSVGLVSVKLEKLLRRRSKETLAPLALCAGALLLFVFLGIAQDEMRDMLLFPIPFLGLMSILLLGFFVGARLTLKKQLKALRRYFG